MKEIKEYQFTKESEKYKFFSTKDIQNFMSEIVRIPYTWNGAQHYKKDFVSIKNSITPIDSFYDSDKQVVCKVPVSLKTKLGGQLQPATLVVNDFTFKIILYRHVGGNYGHDRTMDFSDEWCIDRLVEKGEDYRNALLQEVKERQVTHIVNGDREIEILKDEIKKIENNIEKNLENEEVRLGKIFDGATRKIYAPGSAAKKVIESNKKSDKEVIDTVYGEGYYDNVLGEKPVEKKAEAPKDNPSKGENITHIVFGYDHDEVTGRGR